MKVINKNCGLGFIHISSRCFAPPLALYQGGRSLTARGLTNNNINFRLACALPCEKGIAG